MKLKEPNCDCGTMSKASSQRMDRGDWVPLETYCNFYPLSGSKKTPILRPYKAVQIPMMSSPWTTGGFLVVR